MSDGRGQYMRSSITNSDDPQQLASRVFIGNLPSDLVTKDEVEAMFSPYGPIAGINVLRGYGFVQFENVADAMNAVEHERGSRLKSFNLDVKMAAVGRKPADKSRGGGVGMGGGGMVGGGGGRDFNPRGRGRGDFHDRGGRGGGMGRGGYSEYDEPPSKRRTMDNEPRGHMRDRSPPGRNGPSFRERDSFDRRAPPQGGDSFRRGPGGPGRGDPYMDTPPARDMYPVSDFREPYRDLPPAGGPPYRGDANPVEKPPCDCAVLLLNSKVRTYGDVVVRKLREVSLLVDVNTLTDEKLLTAALEDVSRRGLLYAVVLSEKNEMHRSLTLNILHGAVQEHRNMPLDDAVMLIRRNFDAYHANLSRGNGKLGGGATNQAFKIPDSQVTYLLNLLADHRFLTVDELNSVIKYLQERRQQANSSQSAGSETAMVDQRDADAASKQRQQQELQTKILNILNGSDNSTTTTIPTVATTPTSAPKQLSPYGVAAPSGITAGQGASSAPSTSINFDNPNVQAALDTLISSGPNLLKNITPQRAQPPPPGPQQQYVGYGPPAGYRY